MKRFVLLMGLIAGMGAAVFAQEAALPRLAVVPFSVNTERQKAREDAIAIRNFVQSNMVSSGKYDVMTRDQIDKLLENQRIQVSSISSKENLKKLELENVNYIVTGTVDAIDNDYGVTISILDVSTGRFSHSTSQFMSNTSTDIYNKTAALVRNFQQGLSNEGETVVQTGRSGSSRQYFIGDEGPAGGIVFFDKGESSGGWRYLEAAPSRTESNAEWNRALQICKGMEYGGYRDWRLPSKDELNFMYKNLKQKDLGGFSDNWYWSSEQDRTYACYQSFTDGSQTYDWKVKMYSVRAVRAF